jgi:hypothetical protein
VRTRVLPRLTGGEAVCQQNANARRGQLSLTTNRAQGHRDVQAAAAE